MKRLTLSLALVLAQPFSIGPIAMADDGHGASNLGVKIVELANSHQQWDGALLPSYPTGQPEIKVLKITIPAGVKLPWHYHPVINAAIVLEGALELSLRNGVTKQYNSGEAFIEVVDKAHSGKAIGSTNTVVLVVYAGEKGEATTVLMN